MSPVSTLRRGEVWWVTFDAAIGSEVQKTRPAVVVSNDDANAALSRVQVVPLTSNVGRLYASEAYVELNGQKRKAMADQLTTASKKRFGRRLGQLSPADLADVEQAIRTQLGL